MTFFCAVQNLILRQAVVALCAFLCAALWAEESVYDETTTIPFQGVRYIKRVQSQPVPQVCHLIEIALNAPGIRFTSTEPNGPDAPRESRCETTREFVKRVGAQIGINGNYFIYDNAEDTDLLGLAVSNGVTVSTWDSTWARFAVNIAKDNTVTFIGRPEGVTSGIDTIPKTVLHNALSGSPVLVQKGKVQPEPGGERHPRTGIGLVGKDKLLLLITDGRQPKYSVGQTFHEMAQFFADYGAEEALALDGGGSATLVIADPEPTVMNVPIPTDMPEMLVLSSPGIERHNGNNLAVFALPLPHDNTSNPE